tara:strand:+ start:531 stop:854 length:324 start_codon:yes stop_codon:yes gene_type:complete
MEIIQIIVWAAAVLLTLFWSYWYFKRPELSDEIKAHFKLRVMLFWWLSMIYCGIHGLPSLHFLYIFPCAIIFSFIIMKRFPSTDPLVLFISMAFWFGFMQFILNEYY